MRLKSVKLAGFKSYVDPTVIELPDNVSVIVGPNGCGKSNIVDAIRLGVGESQASLLRGDELAEFIFEGTAVRAPSGQATIELVFDNQDQRIGGSYAKYSEIAIKREICQDSPSQFYVNGRRCRRKDVHDLFLGSGFGARSYSVIEQGFISRIVTAKPEELRYHLEEVAGVSKYRERRRETEKKIESTRENLERVKDHAAELLRQLRYLERQAREAARYSDLKDKERSLQAKLIALRIQSVGEQLATQDAHVQDSSLTLKQELAKLQTIRTTLDTLRVQEVDGLEQFNEIQGDSFEARGNLARVEEENRQLKLRREEAINNQHDTSSKLNEREAQLSTQHAQINTLQSELSEIEQHRTKTEVWCERARAEYVARQSDIHSWRKEWDTFLTKFNKKFNQLTIENDKRKRTRQEFDAIEHRLNELKEILSVQEEEDELTPLHQQKLELEAMLQNELQRATEIDDTLERIERQDSQDETLRQQLERELGEIRERRSALAALIEQTLHKDSESPNEQCTPLHELRDLPRIGEVISVENGYERAVEVVLSSYFHAITANWIEFEPSDLQELHESNVVLVSATSNSTTRTTLVDVITQGREYVEELCAHVFVDDSFAAALKRRKQLQPHESVITKSGIWLGRTWIKFNGGTRAERTLIQNRSELEELNNRHDTTQQSYQQTLQAIVERSEQRTELRKQSRENSQQQNDINARLSKLSSRIEEVKLAQHELSVKFTNAQQEYEANVARKSTLELDLKRQDDSISKLKSITEALDIDRTRLQTQEVELSNALALALRDDRASQAENHRLDVKFNSAQAQVKSYRSSAELLSKNVGELHRDLKVLDKQIEENETAVRLLKVKLSDAVKKSAVADQNLATVRAERETLINQIRDRNVAESQQQQRVDQAQQQTQKFREEQIQLTSKREYLMSELTDLEVEFPEVEQTLDPTEDEEFLTKALHRTRARVEKLGAVNLAAAQDLDNRKAEYVTYQSRIDDLEQSEETLQRAMQKIDKETLMLFNDVFAKVSDNFQSVFARLFRGGQANLVLTGEDPLTAGVRMRVQPPGKQIKNVSQLSDGERALAALAFTFAMFQLNPSPICVLDEVDAPLDQNNVSQLGKLIHSMANAVQFLIITHSRGTMNIAESLIGITMQEAGVSRVVSVELE